MKRALLAIIDSIEEVTPEYKFAGGDVGYDRAGDVIGVNVSSVACAPLGKVVGAIAASPLLDESVTQSMLGRLRSTGVGTHVSEQQSHSIMRWAQAAVKRFPRNTSIVSAFCFSFSSCQALETLSSACGVESVREVVRVAAQCLLGNNQHQLPMPPSVTCWDQAAALHLVRNWLSMDACSEPAEVLCLYACQSLDDDGCSNAHTPVVIDESQRHSRKWRRAAKTVMSSVLELAGRVEGDGVGEEIHTWMCHRAVHCLVGIMCCKALRKRLVEVRHVGRHLYHIVYAHSNAEGAMHPQLMLCALRILSRVAEARSTVIAVSLRAFHCGSRTPCF